MLDSNFTRVLNGRVMVFTSVCMLALMGCSGEAPGEPSSVENSGENTAQNGTEAEAIGSTSQEVKTFERIEHTVAVGPTRFIHLTETRVKGSCSDRAIVLLPGPVTKGSFFNIDVPGYDAGRILAAEGFSAFAADFEGSGASYYPADGLEVTTDSQVEAIRAVINYVRWRRDVNKVDVYGESWGGGVAAEVCSDKARVRSCVLGSMTYKTPGPAAAAQFSDPGFVAFINSQPNNYLQTAPPFYFGLVASSPTAVQDWTYANQPWNYTTRPFRDFQSLPVPFFDPTQARVSTLIVRGENDPNTLASDAAQLVEDYGKPNTKVKLATIPGGGHIPRIEGEPVRSLFWKAVLKFLD